MKPGRGDGRGTGGRFFLALAAGLAIGVVIAQVAMHRARRGLFSRWAARRWSALGYLAGHPSPGHVQLLRDYVKWERRPLLRRRAGRIVRRMEAELESWGG